MSLRIRQYRSGNNLDLPYQASLLNQSGHIQQCFHYWKGASGKRYLHTVYSLLDCPSLPKCNYIMVHHHSDDIKQPLRIGRTVEDASSLNLAYLRQKAAQLGANEIHIHLLANTAGERFLHEMDLRAGLFLHLSANHAGEPPHQKRAV
ncbi:MAG: hypothetical protein AAF228_11480 [Pseudomonadota bacterium]